jgi:hypothetical protein
VEYKQKQFTSQISETPKQLYPHTSPHKEAIRLKKREEMKREMYKTISQKAHEPTPQELEQILAVEDYLWNAE